MQNKIFKLIGGFFILSVILVGNINVKAHPLPNGVNHNTNYYIQDSKLFVKYDVSFYYTDLANFYNSFDVNGNKVLDENEKKDWIQSKWNNTFEVDIASNKYTIKEVAINSKYDEIKDSLYPTINLVVNFGPIQGRNGDKVQLINKYRTDSNDPQDWNFTFDTKTFNLEQVTLVDKENVTAVLKTDISSNNSSEKLSTENSPNQQIMPSDIYTQTRNYLDFALKSNNLGPWAIFILLAIAVLFGTAHTLTPGHGKAVIGTYMAAIHGTFKDAVIMAVSTTLSHTGVVIALGFVFIWLRNGWNTVIPLINFKLNIPAIQLQVFLPYLNTFSGIAIVVIGLIIFRQRVLEFIQHKIDISHNHEHEHNHTEDDHTHTHGENTQTHSHSHGFGEHVHQIPNRKLNLRESVMLGLSTGLTPCLDAVAILILAINLDKAALGIAILLAFSFGMGVTLTAIGWVIGKGVKGASKFSWAKGLLDWLPIISALLITLTGVLLLVQVRL